MVTSSLGQPQSTVISSQSRPQPEAVGSSRGRPQSVISGQPLTSSSSSRMASTSNTLSFVPSMEKKSSSMDPQSVPVVELPEPERAAGTTASNSETAFQVQNAFQVPTLLQTI